jgi:hypothetical protein
LNAEKYLKRLLGRTDIEDGLKRLDKLAHDEALMATAQVLKLAASIDGKVTEIINGVQRIFACGGGYPEHILLHGKEARETAREGEGILRQTAGDVDEMRRS